MRETKYIIQLDSLRAIAVGLVIVSHWIGSDNILNFLPNGMMGVTLFFVLSGFLITRILIVSKIKTEETKQKKSFTIKNFFIRRSLRIFPIYLITIFILLGFNFGLIKQHPIYFFTYTHNFLYHSLNYWPGYISHLWSLAVEEQFYLVWPFIVLFTNKKHFLKLMTGIIFLGLFSHILLDSLYPQNGLHSVLLPTSFYSFGLGGLLAHLYVKNSKILSSLLSKIILIISVGTFILYVTNILQYNKGVFERFLFSIISFYLIHFFYNMKGFILKIFQIKALVYIGKISYGIYLFHPLVNFIYNRIHVFFKLNNIRMFGTNILFFPDIGYPLLRMLFLSILLLLLASLSWFLIEKPINRLKKHFVYNK